MQTPTVRGSRITFIACCLASSRSARTAGDHGAAGDGGKPGLRPATMEWVVNAHLLAAAAFIILGGEMADRLGPRRSSAIGIARSPSPPRPLRSLPTASSRSAPAR